MSAVSVWSARQIITVGPAVPHQQRALPVGPRLLAPLLLQIALPSVWNAQHSPLSAAVVAPPSELTYMVQGWLPTVSPLLALAKFALPTIPVFLVLLLHAATQHTHPRDLTGV